MSIDTEIREERKRKSRETWKQLLSVTDIKILIEFEMQELHIDIDSIWAFKHSEMSEISFCITCFMIALCTIWIITVLRLFCTFFSTK